MKKILSILLVLLFVITQSCGILFWREITCRELLTTYLSWMPGTKGDVLCYVDKSGVEHNFTIDEKYIGHTTMYYSDTGCDCNDTYKFLLKGESDSIWIIIDSDYIEDLDAEIYGEIFCVIGAQRGGYYLSDTIATDTTEYITNYPANKINLYRSENVSYNPFVDEIVHVDKIGIIKLHFSDGEEWLLKDIKEGDVSMGSFSFEEYYCDW